MINNEIHKLIQFALQKQMIQQEDVIWANNILFHMLKIPAGGFNKPDVEISDEACDICMEKILDYCYDNQLISDNTTTARDLMEARIMGVLTPSPSAVNERFFQMYNISPQKATEYFYSLCMYSRYIPMRRIQKNLFWRVQTEYQLEITINLAKPEKDPTEIAKLKNEPSGSYPQCLLCKENVGYGGNIRQPARQNHRIIPLELQGAQWYFQYSPYVYYNEHTIVLNTNHVPMRISRETFARLFDFLRQFPHYFIGSNADLPIVGGSILNHDHFQGGRYSFPIENAATEETFFHQQYGVSAAIVKWPMSTLRLQSANVASLIAASDHIYHTWRGYEDKEAQIIPYSQINEERAPHNTITPIARKHELYEIDIVLRNNRTTKEHPLGLFHPHGDVWHIKKENIGLIEVMGLAILPGRLKMEIDEINHILCGQKSASKNLDKHAPWIHYLKEKYNSSLTPPEADGILKNEIGFKFEKVLKDSGVFKRDKKGKEQFIKFLTHAGFTQCE